MKRIYFIPVFFLIISFAPVDAGAQGLKGREVLGLRLGGVVSPGSVDEYFGHGSEPPIQHLVLAMMEFTPGRLPSQVADS